VTNAWRVLVTFFGSPYCHKVSYPPRNQEPGYHHVGMRGNNKQRIYLHDRDRELFLLMLDRKASKFNWTIMAYALMRNHYHLVLRVDDRGLARGMCELNTGYAVAFNMEYGRANHVFGRRYWSDPATSDEHLKNVVRYVLQNPRRAGAPGPLESHRWTSYRASVGLDFGLTRFGRDELLALFGADPAQAVVAFKVFCEEPPPDAIVSAGHGGWQSPVQNVRVRVT
jgi:REP-associated tyrosine transposase